jgi:hypothetical protein
MANSWTRANPDAKLKTQEAQVSGPEIGADDGIRTRDPHLGKKKVGKEDFVDLHECVGSGL